MITINVGVDLDGVCVNFTKKFSEIANELYGKRCYIIEDPSTIKHWDWYKWYQIKEAEEKHIWTKITETTDFWSSLEVLNLSQWEYFLDKLGSSNNINVYFITNRAETTGICATKQSAIWLTKNGWRYPYVIKTAQKEKFIENLNIEFFIDDNAGNLIRIKERNPDIRLYAQDALYNTDELKRSKIEYKRVSGLRLFVDDILDEVNRREYDLKWKNT